MIGCATCGAPPVGTFHDGSPRWGPDHIHEPIRGVDAVPKEDRIIIVLTPAEMAEADECGAERLAKARSKGWTDQIGEDSIDSHTKGARGERAFAKMIEWPWRCLSGFHGAPDIRGCQIRTVSKTSYRTIVHESDPARTPIVSIVGHGDRFLIRGWIIARDGKRDEWVDDPGKKRSSYFVPTFELHSMATFDDSNEVRAAMGRAPVGV
jgi:hypothetical protein